MLLLLLGLVLGEELDMVQQEIQQTDYLVGTLKAKVDHLKQLQRSLAEAGLNLPSQSDFKKYLFEQGDPNSLEKRLVRKTSIHSRNRILGFEYLVNQGLILACLDGGILEFYTFSEELVQRKELNYQPSFCSVVSDSKKTLVATASHSELRVFSFNSTSLELNYLNSTKLVEDTQVVKLEGYSRMKKLFWVVGDSKGGVSLFTKDCELVSRVNTSLPYISDFRIAGQQLVFAGTNKLGVLNLGVMEVSEMCPGTLDFIVGVAVDQKPTVLYAQTQKGNILVYDTKFSSTKSPSTCRPIARLYNKYPAKHLSVLQDSILTWNGSVLSAFNKSSLYEKPQPPTYFEVKNLAGEFGVMKDYFSLQETQLLVLGDNGYTLEVFRVLDPVVLIEDQKPSTGFDLGTIRTVVFVGGVVVFVIWKSKNFKSKKQRDTEELEKSLQEIRKTMESTEMMSEKLHKGFKSK